MPLVSLSPFSLLIVISEPFFSPEKNIYLKAAEREPGGGGRERITFSTPPWRQVLKKDNMFLITGSRGKHFKQILKTVQTEDADAITQKFGRLLVLN